MKNEPVLSAVRKARSDHAKTPLGKLEALFKERNKWQRRKTIADNKLREVTYRVEEMAFELAGGRR